MGFIKDSSLKFRADPSDGAYATNWQKITVNYLLKHDGNLSSNPTGLENEISKMLTIGGINFSEYGEPLQTTVLHNESAMVADSLLKDGVSVQKVHAFLKEGDGPYAHTQSIDVSGLNREQAETVLQTAIVSQDIAPYISENLCFDEKNSFDFGLISEDLQAKTAVYLNAKREAWQKNGTLTVEGDEDKFNRLMQQAKTITLNPDMTLISNQEKRIPPEEYAEILARSQQYRGKVVNVDDIVTNIDEMTLPFKDMTVEEFLAQKAVDDEQIGGDSPAPTVQDDKPRYSEPYEVEILDTQSNILKDELNERQAYEARFNSSYFQFEIDSVGLKQKLLCQREQILGYRSNKNTDLSQSLLGKTLKGQHQSVKPQSAVIASENKIKDQAPLNTEQKTIRPFNNILLIHKLSGRVR